MSNSNQQQGQTEHPDNPAVSDMNEQMQIRIGKLADLQEQGNDPFEEVVYDVSTAPPTLSKTLMNWKIKSSAWRGAL